MALKGRMSRTILNVSFLALDLSLLFHVNFSSAPGTLHHRRPLLPASPQVVVSRPSAETAVLRSVSIDNLAVFPIVQQPSGMPNYVSKTLGEVTQFSAATKYGNVGLLAHNYLSGRSFFRLAMGQEIHLEYSDGRSEAFVVTEILKYEALDPKSPFSSFRNLDNKEEVLSAQEMFQRAYGGERRVTFQTCIARYGDASWGRLFVVATPKAESLAIFH
jgi:hypothetical protein